MAKVYLSLGSNVENRFKYINSAIIEINKQVGIITKSSDIWESKSWNYSDNDYLNIVIEIETIINPQELLKQCQEIEINLGRTSKTIIIDRKPNYSSRTIDIDILFYDNLIIKLENLTIPHPQMNFRNFVLKPLLQIAPNFIHPILKENTATLYKKCEDKDSIKLFQKINLPNILKL